MASNYPGSLDSFGSIASDKKTSDVVGGRTHRDMHNDLGDAVEAVQAELGTDPAGAYSTVKARFEAIEGATLPAVDAKGDLIVGTADNTYDNVTVGANNTVLVADSGQTAGVKWASTVGVWTVAGLRVAYTAKTGAYTATVSDDVINVTSGTFTLDLPAASSCAGKTLKVKNSGTGVVTLDGNSAETVEGTATFLLGPRSYVEITCTGTAWILTGGTPDTGWRDISASLTNGWSGTCAVRRRGDIVDIRGALSAASVTGYGAFTIPSGFAYYGGAVYGYHAGWSTAGGFVRVYDNGGTLTVVQAAAAVTVNFQISGTSTAIWPASLPGTAV